ncbi:cytochrome P450 [Kribbella sp. NPDC004536]|uniref:cytochrome P450 n=1 Tax=Kribbella sp. NPDC004536 TaxID=3364106 RepID=UPI00369CC2B7
MTEVTGRQRRGQFSLAFSVRRRAMERQGVIPPERVHIAQQFPWAQEPVEADGSPGRHTVLRSILADYLSKDAARELRPVIQQLALELLRDNVTEQLGRGSRTGTIDLARFSATLAFRSMSALASFPHTPDDEAFMISHLDAFARNPTLLAALEPEPAELRSYFEDIVRKHRARGGAGLLGRIVAAYDAGVIRRDERDGLIFGCWTAGRDTTATLIALLFGLVDEAGLHATMMANLDDAGARWRALAIEEALRFTPFPSTPMLSVGEVRLDCGPAVADGGEVMLHWGTANRDPAVFGPDADEYRPGREADRPHLAFGHGLHYCAGAALAKAATEVAALVVYGNLPDLRLTTWERLARLVDVVDTAVAEYDLDGAAGRLTSST